MKIVIDVCDDSDNEYTDPPPVSFRPDGGLIFIELESPKRTICVMASDLKKIAELSG